MLASITPLGERGRGSTWGVTVAAFAIGATAAGALAGVALGALGALAITGLGTLTTRERELTLAVGLALAAGAELLALRVPGPRRQVNERWLEQFRGWVYGLGFGAQLGLGVTTVVTSAATYVAGLAALLTGSPGAGALILGIYGLLRGLTPLVAAGVRRPDQLLSMHARLDRWRVPVERGGAALLAGLLVLCLMAAL